jgi:hypothetical protein
MAGDGGGGAVSGLAELIARLEAAAEGSRELDAAIAVAVFGGGSHDPGTAPHFTTSLDAALTLVPEGRGWLMRSVGGRGFAAISNAGEASQAKTPALALCIAALKARAG